MADVASVFQSPAPASITPVAAPASSRPIYRHSIVPGGAYSRGEVAASIRNDAVVAAHYQRVDVDKLQAKPVAAARAVYVSYRVGNQVFWTKNRVRLSPGETVLTDGHTEIRARCGNLVSDNAREPVADQEPPVALLDQAEPETGSSTMAGARGDDGRPAHVPFFEEWSDASSVAFEKDEPVPGAQALDVPMWFGSANAGSSPYLGSSTGTSGTSLVAPLGGAPRGSNSGGGSGGGNDHNGDGNGNNGSNGSNDHNGDGPAVLVPPVTTTGEVPTTTGGTTTSTVTTTTGVTTNGETTGGSDDDDVVSSVPEPSSLMLLGLGVIGAAARKLRSRR